ncbi:MAG: hypothetical protein Q7R95_01650 [bacterium]|nr:hypothetical protein [bacterium]
MITQNDIIMLKKTFATKDDLRSTTNELIELIKAFRQELKDDMGNLQKEINEQFILFKDSILTEIVKIREDITVTTGYRDMIEDHENRIIKLESKHPNN